MRTKDTLDIDTARKLAWSDPSAWKAKLSTPPASTPSTPSTPSATAPPSTPDANEPAEELEADALDEEADALDEDALDDEADALDENALDEDADALDDEAAPAQANVDSSKLSDEEFMAGMQAITHSHLTAFAARDRGAEPPTRPTPRFYSKEELAELIPPIADEIDRVWDLPPSERDAPLIALCERVGALGFCASGIFPRHATRLGILIGRHLGAITEELADYAALAISASHFDGPELSELIEVMAHAGHGMLRFGVERGLVDDDEAATDRRYAIAGNTVARILDTGTIEARASIAAWCMHQHFPEAVSALRRALRSRSFRVRARALYALVAHSTAKSFLLTESDLRFLVQSLAERATPRRTPLIDDLPWFGSSLEKALVRGRWTSLVGPLVEAVEHLWDREPLHAAGIARSLFAALARLEPAKAAGYLDLALTASSPLARAEGALLLAHLPPAWVEGRLAIALASEPSKPVYEALVATRTKVFGTSPDAPALPPIEHAAAAVTREIFAALELEPTAAQLARHRATVDVYALLRDQPAVESCIEALLAELPAPTPSTTPTAPTAPTTSTPPREPDAPQPLALLAELLVRVGPFFPRLPTLRARAAGASSWSDLLIEVGGARILTWLAGRFPSNGGPLRQNVTNAYQSWLSLLARAVEYRPALPEPERARARALAWRCYRRTTIDATMLPSSADSLSLRERSRYGVRASAMTILTKTRGPIDHTLVPTLLEAGRGPDHAHIAGAFFVQLDPASYGAQLVAYAQKAWAARDLDALSVYAGACLELGVAEIRPLLQAVMAHDDIPAIHSLAEVAIKHGVIGNDWYERALANPSSWNFPGAVIALRASNTARLFEVLEGPEGAAREGRARLEAASTLVFDRHIGPLDPRVLLALRSRNPDGSLRPLNPRPTFLELLAEPAPPIEEATRLLNCIRLITNSPFHSGPPHEDAEAAPLATWPFVARLTIDREPNDRQSRIEPDEGQKELTVALAATIPPDPAYDDLRDLASNFRGWHFWDEDSDAYVAEFTQRRRRRRMLGL